MTRTDTLSGHPAPARLYSLDLLRGLDMFLLVVVGPLFAALDAVWRLPPCVMDQFRHFWGGFTLWDLIMPLFIFMCGAAVPFALGRRIGPDGRPAKGYFTHVLSRVALLWILGMVSQGRLLSFDINLINPFNNTLQAIASGYLVAAIAYAIPCRCVRYILPAALAAAYTAFLAFFGDYTPDGNAATRFEYFILPRITPAASQALALADKGYSWWATIPMFGAITLCGSTATEILQSAAAPWKRFAHLAAFGGALGLAGLALAPAIPPVKHIYTLSFTAQATGLSILLLAALYAITDILKFRRGLGLFILFGQCSLMAYMCHEFKTVFRAFADEFTPGCRHLFGDNAAPLATWFFSTLLLTAVLHVWRARKKCYNKRD